MIKTDPKPHKVIDFYLGEVMLDVLYKFEVTKHTNGEVKYQVESITPEVQGDKLDIVTKTIINHCTREGLGQI